MNIGIFYNLAFGGAKRVVFDQVKYLRKNGHSVDVYTTDELHDAFDMEQVADHTFCYVFSRKTMGIPFIRQLHEDYSILSPLKKLHEKIAQDIDKKKYDVVLVHPDHLTQAPYLLQFLKTPSVYYCQEPLRIAYEYGMRFQNSPSPFHSLYESRRRWLRKKIDIENVRSATATIASCYHIRERMIEAYDVLPYVVYAGVDIHTFKPGKKEKNHTVFFVGSTTDPFDGYQLAKKAVDLIPESYRPQLSVVSWTKENGDRLSDEELSGIYSESLVTLCMSRFETFGLVPLESMASGTAVIATNVSGHRETVSEKAGFLVDFDPEEIREKIEFLLNKKHATAYGKQARAYIEAHWAWEEKIKDLEKVLQKIASV